MISLCLDFDYYMYVKTTRTQLRKKIFINSNIIFDSIFYCFNSLHEYFNVSDQIRFP